MKIYNKLGFELRRVTKEEMDSWPLVYGIPTSYAVQDYEIYFHPIEEVSDEEADQEGEG